MKTFTVKIMLNDEQVSTIEKHRASHNALVCKYGGPPDAILTTARMLRVMLLCGIDALEAGSHAK